MNTMEKLTMAGWHYIYEEGEPVRQGYAHPHLDWPILLSGKHALKVLEERGVDEEGYMR